MGGISVADIILAVDEPIDATQCGGKENCQDDRKCLTHDLWAALNERIFEYLGAVSLRQLVDKQKAKEAARQEGVAQVHDMRDGTKRSTISA
jgi:Rrf2 family iron-sulfur cluster assembly transcriptional regulator